MSGPPTDAADAAADAAADDTADAAVRIALAWRELRRGANAAALRAHLVDPAGPTLEQSQLDALEILSESPAGWRMSEFADALRVEPSTATRTIDRLQRLGLAERVSDHDDRRIVQARVTALGRKVLRGVTVRRSAGMERLLEPFTPDEAARLADLLERLVASIDRLVAEIGPGNDVGRSR